MFTKGPRENPHPTPPLFRHAAWCRNVHSLYCFAKHGHTSQAVNLRGQANRKGREHLHWIHITDFVVDLKEALQLLCSTPILIGHSIGGFIIHKYLGNHDVPRTVSWCSSLSVGLLPLALRKDSRHSFIFVKINLILSLFLLIAIPKLVHVIFFSDDVPKTIRMEYGKHLMSTCPVL